MPAILKIITSKYLFPVFVLVFLFLVFGGWRIWWNWVNNQPTKVPKITFWTKMTYRDKILLTAIFVWLLIFIIAQAYFTFAS